MTSIVIDMLKRIGIVIPKVNYDTVVAFVSGYDAGTELLSGFREWLIVRVNGRCEFSWSGLVLFVAFPDSQHPHELLADKQANEHAIETVIKLLEEFLHIKQLRGGMRAIYREYEEWLNGQSWYDSSLQEHLEL